MPFVSSLSALLAALLTSAPAVQSLATPPRTADAATAVGKAVYLITNDAANAVVALPIGADGKLSRVTTTPTGGAGGVAVDSNGQPATPDALNSQSSLTVVGHTIFAINAGSNTLSMLSISPSDPTDLRLVGKPVPIPGDFPNTVAASSKHNLVCVGATGVRAGISCSRFSARGVEPMDALRPFALGQTTPPHGPLNTVSQVFFSPDESMLFATVKGNGNTTTGFFSAFPVQRSSCGSSSASVSHTEQRSSPNGTAVLFGSRAIPNTHRVFATDASFGAVVLAVDPATGRATTLAKGAIPGQKATCWATLSPATGTAFVTDAATNRIVEMSVSDASIVSETDLNGPEGREADPGLIDLAAAGRFLYALSPGNGTTQAAVAVVDVRANGGKGKGKPALVQHFGLGKAAGPRAMGMAVLV
ncbi:0fe6f173-7891-461d-b070-6148f408c0bd [Thermothielavioides terrestris]|uniref:3-carboxymuconate cyclase n=2 Tax=Thermothielavioides terrestris TaxID=2587410 RepID=G2R6K0_THETT|nr:uncharacterized protein THITE_2145623 [Thermothielavioides terrestris NRRL 8126]AEO68481.1 hypothetical protein THITE_2145623 [Thermothielavioides terrestris NRRL 8126]SPQ24245.1 0fe6f173-7891-461d-b070-6148f408c0bd [Thermothielavioides terrestris]